MDIITVISVGALAALYAGWGIRTAVNVRRRRAEKRFRDQGAALFNAMNTNLRITTGDPAAFDTLDPMTLQGLLNGWLALNLPVDRKQRLLNAGISLEDVRSGEADQYTDEYLETVAALHR